jgi:glucokinase
MNIVNLAKHHGVNVADAKTFFLRLSQQDSSIQPIFQQWLGYLTQFLKWVDRYYAPEAFILTGGVLKSKAFFWDALQAAVPHIPLAMATFGQDAGLMGAANLAFSLI